MSRGFSTELRRRSTEWVEAGVISAEQREALLALAPEETGGGGRFAAILAFAGGGLLLAGVCLLISANWRDIGDWTKIAGLIALLAATYFGGWRCRLSPGRYPKIGDGLFMVGAGLFMAGIALVSQIYHLNDRPADFVLIWCVGIAPLPWLTGSKGAQFVSVLAALVWFGFEMNTPGSWLEIGGRSDHAFFASVACYTLAGVALWLTGMNARSVATSRFAGVFEWWGVLLTCGCLYVLGFVRHGWGWRHDDAPTAWNTAAPMLGLALAGGGLLLKRGVSRWGWLPAALAFSAVPVLAIVGNFQVGDGGWLWSGLSWLSLFVLSFAMIHAGLKNGREAWVNLGVGFIALNIVTRYFDLFGTMMEGGVFFIVSGAVVLGGGFWLERKRRVWMAELRAAREVQS